MRTGDRTKGMAIAAAAMAVCLGIAAGGEQPQASGLILGQVVDAGSGQDVPGVVVSLGSPGAGVASAELIEMGPVRGPVGARRVLTAADGRFLFRDLPRGRYELAVVAPGYVPGSYGQNRPSGPGRLIDLGDGEKLGAVSVRIWKVASISGTVLDESGEPAVGVSVSPVNVRSSERSMVMGVLSFVAEFAPFPPPTTPSSATPGTVWLLPPPTIVYVSVAPWRASMFRSAQTARSPRFLT